jgi:mannosyltransferase OCH1-like enzyme
MSEPVGDIYRFSPSESPVPNITRYKIVSFAKNTTQTNILDVHYRFATERPSEYVAVFEKLGVSTVKITVLTSTLQVGLALPSLSFRIQGGPRQTMPAATQYPIQISYPPAFLSVPVHVPSSLSQPAQQTIPRRIIQTWPSRFVSQSMGFATEAVIRLNPEYEYSFYTSNEALDFVKTNFNKYVQKAYSLLSENGRADLFRYCFLYKHGGVFVPMKSVPQVPLYSYMPMTSGVVLIEPIQQEAIHMSISIMASPPSHPCVDFVIRQITWFVLSSTQGKIQMDISGPSKIGQTIYHYVTQRVMPNSRILYFQEYSPQKISIVNRMRRTLLYDSYETYNNDLLTTNLFNGSSSDSDSNETDSETRIVPTDAAVFYATPLLPLPQSPSSVLPLPSSPPSLPSPPSPPELASADALFSQ